MVEGVNLKYDSETGISRGFAFVTFTDEASVKLLLKRPYHTINNKYVEARRAKSRPNLQRIFVGGIDSTLSEADILNYFSRFGKVRQ